MKDKMLFKYYFVNNTIKANGLQTFTDYLHIINPAMAD